MSNLLSDGFLSFMEHQQRFKNFYIYYGCRHKPGEPASRQPKNITRDWFINYEFFDETTGRWERQRDHGKTVGGWNHITNTKERLRIITNYSNALLALLKSGQYNPLQEKTSYLKRQAQRIAGQQATTRRISELRTLPVIEALKQAIQGRIREKASVDTIKDYKYCLNHLAKGITTLGYQVVTLENFTDEHYLEALNETHQLLNLSNHSRNKVKSATGGLFGWLKEQKAIKSNPANGIAELKTFKTAGYKSPTIHQLKNIILPYLRVAQSDLFDLVVLMWNMGLREKELCTLKLSYLDVAAGRYRIIPEIIAETNQGVIRSKKTQAVKEGVLTPEALFIIKKRLKKYPGAQPGWFLFAKGYGIDPVPLVRKTLTRDWKLIVKEHLRQDVDLYGIRHTTAGTIVSSESLKKAQLHLGHETEKITEGYAGAAYTDKKQAEEAAAVPPLLT